MPNIIKKLCFVASIGLTACGGGQSHESAATPPITPSAPMLRDQTSMPIGVALGVGRFESSSSIRYSPQASQLRNLAASEFSSVVAENVMKPEYIHPQENQYNWSDGDYLVKFAQQNHMQIHGHTLVWHNALPSWMSNYSGDWESMLADHITTVVSHYSSDISSWDVVNEAFLDDGSPRTTLWSTHIPDYLAKAYTLAHAADPDAELYYNDYNIEAMPKKLGAVLKMVTDFRTRDIPIDGIGFQLHIDRYWPSTTEIGQAFSRCVAMGLKVRISELDIRMNPDNTATALTPELAELQRQRYREVVRTYLNTVPAELRGGITVWGLTDALSWTPWYYKIPDWPLLFDANFQRKPAWTGLSEALNATP
jgi:endo-1,4-beta-xylanase